MVYQPISFILLRNLSVLIVGVVVFILITNPAIPSALALVSVAEARTRAIPPVSGITLSTVSTATIAAFSYYRYRKNTS